jgi:hypothetical protein
LNHDDDVEQVHMMVHNYNHLVLHNLMNLWLLLDDNHH